MERTLLAERTAAARGGREAEAVKLREERELADAGVAAEPAAPGGESTIGVDTEPRSALEAVRVLGVGTKPDGARHGGVIRIGEGDRAQGSLCNSRHASRGERGLSDLAMGAEEESRRRPPYAERPLAKCRVGVTLRRGGMEDDAITA